MKFEDFASFLKTLGCVLDELPRFHRLAFATSCCERAYPNYESFARRESWGNTAALSSALDAVWQLVTDSCATQPWDVLLDRCKAATPDSDVFYPKTAAESVLITAGQEAAFMVTLLLELRMDGDSHHAVEIAQFARETVSRYVQADEEMDPNDPALEEKVAQHPLMVQEFQKQKHDLSALIQAKTASELSEFQRHAIPEFSNIGIKNPRSESHGS